MRSVFQRLWYPQPVDAVLARWLFLIFLPIVLLLGFVIPDLLCVALFLLLFVLRGIIMIRSSRTHRAPTEFSITLRKQSRKGLHFCRIVAFALPLLSLFSYFPAPSILFLVLSGSCVLSIFFLALSKLPAALFYALSILLVSSSFIISGYQAGFPGVMVLLIFMLVVFPEPLVLFFRSKASDSFEYV